MLMTIFFSLNSPLLNCEWSIVTFTRVYTSSTSSLIIAQPKQILELQKKSSPKWNLKLTFSLYKMTPLSPHKGKPLPPQKSLITCPDPACLPHHLSQIFAHLKSRKQVKQPIYDTCNSSHLGTFPVLNV